VEEVTQGGERAPRGEHADDGERDVEHVVAIGPDPASAGDPREEGGRANQRQQSRVARYLSQVVVVEVVGPTSVPLPPNMSWTSSNGVQRTAREPAPK